MMACNGEGCTCRAQCLRYLDRAKSELVSRVLCRLPQTPWRIEVKA